MIGTFPPILYQSWNYIKEPQHIGAKSIRNKSQLFTNQFFVFYVFGIISTWIVCVCDSMKLDIHNHILPESWPDLKKVSSLEHKCFLIIFCKYLFFRNTAMGDGFNYKKIRDACPTKWIWWKTAIFSAEFNQIVGTRKFEFRIWTETELLFKLWALFPWCSVIGPSLRTR